MIKWTLAVLNWLDSVNLQDLDLITWVFGILFVKCRAEMIDQLYVGSKSIT